MEPCALLPRREVDVCLRPATWPVVLGAVERRGAEPVLPGEIARVVNAESALLGRVYEKEAAERPEGLSPERRLRLLVHDDDRAARVHQLRRRDQASESRT